MTAPTMSDTSGTASSGHRSGPPIALVAGGSRGLGLALAGELGRAGFRVVITARTVDDLRRASDQLTADGITVLTRVHDVRAARDALAVYEQMTERNSQ